MDIRTIINIVCVLSFVSNVKSLDVLIGNHINSTYYAEENTDIQPFIIKAFDSLKNHTYIRIHIAEGTYFMSGVLQVPSNVQLFGSKNNDNVLATQIMMNSTKTTDLSVIQIFSKSNISISDIIFNSFNNFLGINSDVNGIYTKNVVDFEVRNVEFSNFRTGLYIIGSNDLSTGPIVVDRVSSQKNLLDGIVIAFAHDVRIHDSNIMYNKRHGINMFGKVKQVYIHHNNIYDNGNTITLNGCGMNLEVNKETNVYMQDVIIDSNMLMNNPLGVCLKGVTNTKVHKNTILAKSRKACVRTEDVQAIIIENNNCNVSETVRSPKKSLGYMQRFCNWFLVFIVISILNVL
jgi:hypothetical protein